MAQRITSKNLQYDSSLPPFLARLHGRAAGNGDVIDPSAKAHRKMARPRSGSAEAEDGPLVVDREGNILDGVKLEADGTLKTGDGSPKDPETADTPIMKEDNEYKSFSGNEKIVRIGGIRKRKAGKLIIADEEVIESAARGSKSDHTATSDLGAKNGSSGGAGAARKTIKKPKKIKLSFGLGES